MSSAAPCPECSGTGHCPPVPTARRGRLDRGGVREWLIGKLARGEGDRAALADSLGVSASAIAAFERRHATVIEAARDELYQRLDDLWIAGKLSRLAELQQDADDVITVIEDKISRAEAMADAPDPEDGHRGDPLEDLPTWLRVKAAILRAAAEELGQIPQRVNVDVAGSVVTYRIDGIDLDAV